MLGWPPFRHRVIGLMAAILMLAAGCGKHVPNVPSRPACACRAAHGGCTGH